MCLFVGSILTSVSGFIRQGVKWGYVNGWDVVYSSKNSFYTRAFVDGREEGIRFSHLGMANICTFFSVEKGFLTCTQHHKHHTESRRNFLFDDSLQNRTCNHVGIGRNAAYWDTEPGRILRIAVTFPGIHAHKGCEGVLPPPPLTDEQASHLLAKLRYYPFANYHLNPSPNSHLTLPRSPNYHFTPPPSPIWNFTAPLPTGLVHLCFQVGED